MKRSYLPIILHHRIFLHRLRVWSGTDKTTVQVQPFVCDTGASCFKAYWFAKDKTLANNKQVPRCWNYNHFTFKSNITSVQTQYKLISINRIWGTMQIITIHKFAQSWGNVNLIILLKRTLKLCICVIKKKKKVNNSIPSIAMTESPARVCRPLYKIPPTILGMNTTW